MARRKRIETIRDADGRPQIVEYYEDLGPSRAAGVNRMTGGSKGHRNRGQVRTITPAGLTPQRGIVPSRNKKHPEEKDREAWLRAVGINYANQQKLRKGRNESK